MKTNEIKWAIRHNYNLFAMAFFSFIIIGTIAFPIFGSLMGFIAVVAIMIITGSRLDDLENEIKYRNRVAGLDYE
jgi:hypothetical protein